MPRWVHITSLLALEATSMAIFVEKGAVLAAIYVLGVVGAGLTGFNLGGGWPRPDEETRVRYQCRGCAAALGTVHFVHCEKMRVAHLPPSTVTLEDCVEVAGMVTVTDPPPPKDPGISTRWGPGA